MNSKTFFDENNFEIDNTDKTTENSSILSYNNQENSSTFYNQNSSCYPCQTNVWSSYSSNQFYPSVKTAYSHIQSRTTNDFDNPINVCSTYQSCLFNSKTQLSSSNENIKQKSSTRRSKHIPHHLRPKHIVDRRNTRERRRVQSVNKAFLVLKKLLPNSPSKSLSKINKCTLDINDKTSNISKRTSKVSTLRKAIEYIEALRTMLDDTSDGNSNINELFSGHSEETSRWNCFEED
ncbi:unnamed protein product [Didymodactylos carnosus]|uniref:BHLH domain-containing protein n=1 Tax=Didymodactylos carnosus TaxID=1234261 RepID=A0A813PLQ4_9BILA|nr:unnamed protein product [Didymodactylos carnosus]CAF3536247.1 unnamed protein product [Didymodactylos carnosus]